MARKIKNEIARTVLLISALTTTACQQSTPYHDEPGEYYEGAEPDPIPFQPPAPPGNGVEGAAYQVLLVSCNGCHNAQTNAGGFGFVLDAARMRTLGLVVPGNAANSKLYQQVVQNLMPLGGNLDAASKLAIQQWIDAGAKDFGGAVTPPPPPKNIITLDSLNIIFNNIQLISAANRPNIRYLILTHIYRGELQQQQKDVIALAPAKALNSVHWRTRIVAPNFIDADKTVIQIDLRNYDITPAEWDTVVANYPYRSILERSVRYAQIQQDLGTSTPVVRADWFVREILVGQKYKNLLELPNTLLELEQKLGVDSLANLLANRVIRVGVEDSGVSFSNRVFERHQSQFGAYWRSYDFETSAGDQNIFFNPLGPPANSASLAFRENGGEMIFALPGGLHGYMLSDAAGNYLELGPRQIVQDPTRADRDVVNGVSCFTCHTAGIIPRQDEIRDDAANRFRGNNLLRINLQYPGNALVKAQIDTDIANYMAAQARLGINGSGEPISTSTLYYDDEMTTAMMAAELDVSTATLTNLLRSNGAIRRLLGIQTPTAPVVRANFERAFRDIAVALGVGQ